MSDAASDHAAYESGQSAPADLCIASVTPATVLASDVQMAHAGTAIVCVSVRPGKDLSADLQGFIPLLFLVARPVAVYVGLWGTQMERPQRRLIAWFGIRGTGPMY